MTAPTKTVVTVKSDSLSGAIVSVQAAADRYNLSTLAALQGVERAMMLADGIAELRALVAPLMPKILRLMNTPLGFDTDRNPKKGDAVEPYSAEVVTDCVVEALLRGLQIAGNEFNIIAGKCYTTQSGYKRITRDLPGITDLDYAISPSFVLGGHTCCRVRAEWKYGGKKMFLRDTKGEGGRVYAIRVNKGMGVDAIMGKAERRMFKSIFELCTGTEFSEPMSDEAPLGDLPAGIAGPKTTGQKLLEQMAAEPAKDVTAAAQVAAPPRGKTWQSVIAERRHVVDDEEFLVMVESYGKFDVDQLDESEKAALAARLEAIASTNT